MVLLVHTRSFFANGSNETLFSHIPPMWYMNQCYSTRCTCLNFLQIHPLQVSWFSKHNMKLIMLHSLIHLSDTLNRDYFKLTSYCTIENLKLTLVAIHNWTNN